MTSKDLYLWSYDDVELLLYVTTLGFVPAEQWDSVETYQTAMVLNHASPKLQWVFTGWPWRWGICIRPLEWSEMVKKPNKSWWAQNFLHASSQWMENLQLSTKIPRHKAQIDLVSVYVLMFKLHKSCKNTWTKEIQVSHKQVPGDTLRQKKKKSTPLLDEWSKTNICLYRNL